MRCGVRFCGGCNTRYDRGAALQELERQLKDEVDFAVAVEGEEYDFLLVIGGCTNCCASHEQFTTSKGVIKMWDAGRLDDIVSAIRNL